MEKLSDFPLGHEVGLEGVNGKTIAEVSPLRVEAFSVRRGTSIAVLLPESRSCQPERLSGRNAEKLNGRVSMKADRYLTSILRTAIGLAFLSFLCRAALPQNAAAKGATGEPQAESPAEPPKDTLGRTTPRGTVVGFLAAERQGNTEIAVLYLNTTARDAGATALVHQLAAVLNSRLPARLNEISDKPEGSLLDRLGPDEDLVGTIKTRNGNLDVLVERVDRGKLGKVWLFSRKTLDSIPDVFRELNPPAIEKYLPAFLINTRIATIPLFQWLAFLVGLPLVYWLTGILNRILSYAAGFLPRRGQRNSGQKNPRLLVPPVRLLLLTLAIFWMLPNVPMPLLARQFWSTTAVMIEVVACMWLLMLLNAWAERYLGHYNKLSGSAAVLRLGRRVVDGLILFGGLLFTLHHFGVSVTGVMAGLGVGGIAVALAAQKTLENAIAGVSIIADQAVRVGDVLNLGDVQGTVEEVGLRSTRLRTVDRTLVSLPNGQIANMKLETLSARDRFWFHPVIGLRYGTTPVQLRAIVNGVRDLLVKHAKVESDSARVRFVKFGASSLDVEIFAYVFARDWNHFLEIQEELLLSIMDLVGEAGAEIALPAQTLYLASDPSGKDTQPVPYRERREGHAIHDQPEILSGLRERRRG